MARVLQLRKGNAQVNDIFIGSEAELTYVTDTKGLIIHDGDKRGGYQIPVVVDSMVPTEENGYTWYRKYSDGWVEQGGIKTATSSATITLAIPMSNNKYYVSLQASNASGYQSYWVVRTNTTTTTSFVIHTSYDGATGIYWEVKGYAA